MFLRLPIKCGMTKWVIACLTLFLACTIHYSNSMIASDYYREFVFYNKTNHILSLPTGLVNATEVTSKVTDKMACVFACTRSRLWCGSVNFKVQPENDSLHICELLSTDMYTNPTFLKPVQGFTHLSIKNKCKNPSPCQNNGLCSPDYDNDEYHCVCNATKGKHCELFYSDCSELRSAGYTADGVYQIDPDGQGLFPVYCDMTTDGGGWTAFQRLDNGLISFNRGWQDYKTGFGNVHAEFWLGLDKIYRLTKRPKVTKLRIDLEASTGNKGYAVYSSFSVTDEKDFYRLRVSGYSGTAGDSILATQSVVSANNKPFSTPDKDNDICLNCNCAAINGRGWWYGWCGVGILNNKNWNTFSQIFRTEMKLK